MTKEQILTGIKDLYNEVSSYEDAWFALGKVEEYIKSLPEVLEMPDNLDEAAKQYHERIQFSSRPSFYDAFIAGAEWLLGELKKKENYE